MRVEGDLHLSQQAVEMTSKVQQDRAFVTDAIDCSERCYLMRKCELLRRLWLQMAQVDTGFAKHSTLATDLADEEQKAASHCAENDDMLSACDS
jgi:hypothetical protein